VYSPFGDEEDSLELKLAFDGEMPDGKMFLPIVGQALVKGPILFGGDVLRVPRPDWLGLVELLVFNRDFFDLLRLLWLVLIVDLLDLGLVFILFFFDLFFVVFYFLKKMISATTFRDIARLLTFSTSFVTASWMGYEMNSECFLTISLIFFSSRYSS
jgi:hypothetical protein